MENPLAALSDALAAAVERAGRSVVTVNGRSGIHWQAGVVVTADHVLRGEDSLSVALPDGRTVSAKLAGRDPATDLAVVRAETNGLPVAERGDATLRPGNLVLAVGRSAETGATAALGAISALAGSWRTWRGGLIDSFVRLDMGAYPGLSGSAIVTAGGVVAGLATAGLSRSSVIAIPAATVDRIGNELLATGKVRRGYLGVGLQPVALPSHLREKLRISAKTALMLVNVEPGGPAERAGLLIGDVLVRISGHDITDVDDVQAALGAESIGAKLPATVVRGGELAEVTIEARER